MAERSKAVDLRPTIVMMRGFESLFAQIFLFIKINLFFILTKITKNISELVQRERIGNITLR